MVLSENHGKFFNASNLENARLRYLNYLQNWKYFKPFSVTVSPKFRETGFFTQSKASYGEETYVLIQQLKDLETRAGNKFFTETAGVTLFKPFYDSLAITNISGFASYSIMYDNFTPALSGRPEHYIKTFTGSRPKRNYTAPFHCVYPCRT